MSNLRMYARDLPQSLHRFLTLTLNFSFGAIPTILHFFAKTRFLLGPWLGPDYFLNGIPHSVNSARACSLFFAVVTIVTVIPRT